MYAQAQWYVLIRCGQTKLEIILKARNRRRRRGEVYDMKLSGGGEKFVYDGEKGQSGSREGSRSGRVWGMAQVPIKYSASIYIRLFLPVPTSSMIFDVREQADDFEAQVRESLTFSLPSPLSPSVSASPVSCIYICSDNNQYHPKTPKTTEVRLTTSAKRIHSSIPFTNASSPDGIAS